mgnify:CR=1 FL=1
MKFSLDYDTSDLTFFSCCDGHYLNFVEPFIYFAKKSNPGCKIELYVTDPDKFRSQENVTFNRLPKGRADVLRYILEPIEKTQHTYICDIDIMHTEHVQPFHLLHMQETNLTFSNIYRTNKVNRLSGLHFVETSSWYSDTALARSKAPIKGQDETILHDITRASYPDVKFSLGLSKRPIHGIHVSVGRPIYDIPGWEVTSDKLTYFKETIEESGEFNPWFTENVVNKLLPSKKRKKI